MTDTAGLSTDDRVVLSRFAPHVSTDDAEAATRYVARFRGDRVPSWAREDPAALAEVSA